MRKTCLSASVIAAVVACGALGHAETKAARIPIQADLVQPLEAGRVKVGDKVLAKVQVKWDDAQCPLRQGAILQGRVVAESARSKTSSSSQLALVFDQGECGGPQMKPLPLTVAALLAPDPTQAGNYEYQALSSAVGVGIGGGGGGNLRSVSQAGLTVQFEPPRHKKQQDAVMPGQVIGIADVKLSVGSGPEGSTIFTAARHNMRLEQDSQLVLVPRAKTEVVAEVTPSAFSSGPGGATTNAITETKTVVFNPVPDETDVCAPPQCSVALAPAEETPGTTQASATVSIKDLGYEARVGRELYGFDYDAALAYLGPKQLLFTFNPHQLVTRSSADDARGALRTVRGVVINLESMKVQQTVDWRVLSTGQYLWPVGQDRVLVHVGKELRLYGPGLKVEQKIPLDGPLAFVRISPSSKYVAIGMIQERHSEATHRQLLEAENRAPEEDVLIQVFNGDFLPMVKVLRSSRMPTPILSDAGEVQIPTIGKDRWRIVEHTWDSQRRVIAQLSSTCRPEASSLQGNLLFVVGCDRQADGKWYRVLRQDGKTLLKGWCSSQELEQTASGSPDGGAFAIGIAKAMKALSAESAFKGSDLESQRIAVYRPESGERVFSVNVPSPVPTVQTFVLSPDGRQLAVLGKDQIAFYGMPK